MKKNRTILLLLILCSLILLLFLFIASFSYESDSSESLTTASITDTTVIPLPEENSEPEYEKQSSSCLAESENLTDSAQETSLVTELNDTRVTYDNDFYYESLSDEIINRIYGISYKPDCPVPFDELCYVHILYINFNGESESGELICNKLIAWDLVEIFYELYIQKYPLEHVRLVDEYDADDTLSMLDNNTSCFNYRTVEGTDHISKHGLGLAIDINPFYNPYVVTRTDGSIYISPEGSESYADRSLDFPHKITEDDLCYQLFIAHGFQWGGHWVHTKDYQHFFKDASNP